MVKASGRNYRKLELSVESMEIFTTSMEAPTTSMEGSINLHEKKKKLEFFLSNGNDILLFSLQQYAIPIDFKIRQTCENCMKTRRRSVVYSSSLQNM